MGENWARLAERRRDTLGDVLLALAVLAFAVPAILTGRSFSLMPVPETVRLAVASAAAAAMLVRRRTPWPLVTGTAACALFAGQLVPLTLAAYSLTAERGGRRRLGAVAALAVAYVVVDRVSPYTDHAPLLAVIWAAALVCLPALVGHWVWCYRAMIRELRERARADQEHVAALERRRIARELHDTVTHAVTVMVLNAGLIQDTDDLGEIRKLARAIEDKGVRALTELRELLTALRSSDLPPSAESVEGIPRLVEESRATGLRVALHYEVPEETLSREAGHTCYRVVQEGLNNVRKHAPGTDVQVVCEARGDTLDVSVVNGGGGGGGRAAPARVPAHEGSGYGLTGLSERVALQGGRLTYGSTADGGFALRASIPYRPTGGPAR
ncbi:two-component sensor histidine kinase [Microbispora cellulosiformans]|uniref:histidine kinase n=1 Tax=Microbispora cellulosiformans TaxID=2614688 RepID=A0A5J5K7I1_9ACTN|nr:histidine kinase [Microbispora cellulosiformans]KAA9380406.1 two-component sensor histidine kinase [Microbispora cellulosiformans]